MGRYEHRIAVALDERLIVPVVKDADQKSLLEISQTVRTLVRRARAGKLMPGDVTGGTFTTTNLGALGGGYSFETAIINQPVFTKLISTIRMCRSLLL